MFCVKIHLDRNGRNFPQSFLAVPPIFIFLSLVLACTFFSVYVKWIHFGSAIIIIM